MRRETMARDETMRSEFLCAQDARKTTSSSIVVSFRPTDQAAAGRKTLRIASAHCGADLVERGWVSDVRGGGAAHCACYPRLPLEHDVDGGESKGIDPERQPRIRAGRTPPTKRKPQPTLDAIKAVLLQLFLRRYITYCARHRSFAAMDGAAWLFANVARVGLEKKPRRSGARAGTNASYCLRREKPSPARPTPSSASVAGSGRSPGWGTDQAMIRNEP